MKRVIIVQARMGSVRLPGKTLMDLAGSPMLAQQLRRLKECQRADEIVVATTVRPDDTPIISISKSESVRWFRGSADNVLERYVGAARESKADVIVRVTADCPLIDPMITDQVIETLEIRPAEIDYAANIVEGHRTYPRGLDTEVFFRDTLERVYRLARTEPSVEHVTYFIRSERPDLFLIQPVTDLEDNSDLRWCVDESEDMDMVRRLYQELQLEQHSHSYQEILSYVRAHPDISAMNTRVRQKTV